MGQNFERCQSYLVINKVCAIDVFLCFVYTAINVQKILNYAMSPRSQVPAILRGSSIISFNRCKNSLTKHSQIHTRLSTYQIKTHPLFRNLQYFPPKCQQCQDTFSHLDWRSSRSASGSALRRRRWWCSRWCSRRRSRSRRRAPAAAAAPASEAEQGVGRGQCRVVCEMRRACLCVLGSVDRWAPLLRAAMTGGASPTSVHNVDSICQNHPR